MVTTRLRETDADWAGLTAPDSIIYPLGYAPSIDAGVSPFAAGATLAIIGRDGAAFVLGTMTEGQMMVFEAAQAALAIAVADLRPGMTAQAAHRMIRSVVQRAGFDFPHHSGHGIGASVHEHPRLCQGETTVLRAGMVLMIEPGAYDAAIGGARTEWMLHMTETGCVPLAPFPLVACIPG